MTAEFELKSDEELVLLPNSHWASNIGNPFFTLAAKYILNRVFPNARILQTAQLSSAAWTPNDTQMRRSLNYVEYYDPDWLVLCGPMMSESFVDKYEPVLNRMNTEDMNIALLSVGSIKYNDTEVQRCREFLENHPPKVLFTRDSWTYDTYHDLAEYSYDAIDLAFFTPDFYQGFPTPRLSPYVTFTFDKVAEPDVELQNPSDPSSAQVNDIKHGRVRRRAERYLNHDYPERIEEYTIVRPTHGVLNRSERSLYNKPNAFFAQTPHGYLNLYRNTNLTLSDRVHACVPTIAYGGTAQLFTDSPRARLFERVGVGEIHEHPVSVSMNNLRTEKEHLLSELQNAIDAA